MKKSSNRLGRRESIEGLLLVTPEIVYLLIFFLLPLGICIYAGFTNWNILSPLRKFVGLRNVFVNTKMEKIIYEIPEFYRNSIAS